jgi:hypothetical protein
MPAQRPKVDFGSEDAARDVRLSAVERKLTSFLGVMVGVREAAGFDSMSLADVDVHGFSFDWEPWIRFMQPDFAVVMSANRLDGGRQPVKVIVAQTGQVIPLDGRNCHPSDASLLLSGDEMGKVNALIDALDLTLRGMDDGSRVSSARTVLTKLRRICRVGQ